MLQAIHQQNQDVCGLLSQWLSSTLAASKPCDVRIGKNEGWKWTFDMNQVNGPLSASAMGNKNQGERSTADYGAVDKAHKSDPNIRVTWQRARGWTRSWSQFHRTSGAWSSAFADDIYTGICMHETWLEHVSWDLVQHQDMVLKQDMVIASTPYPPHQGD